MHWLDHFGLIAPIYERLIQGGDFSSLERLLDLPCDGWLLDAAGGTGRVSKALAGKLGGVVIMDLSRPMLRQARGSPGLALVQAEAETLPFAAGSFDRILMVDAFHHLNDQSSTACELWRVLRPGGSLVIEEPDIDTPGAKLIAWVEKLLLMRSHFWRAEKIAALFRERSPVEIVRQAGTAWVIVRR